MADNRTMAELLQAPTEGYEDAIVIPEIAANNFELKHGLINLVQNKQFFRHDKEDPHAHIRYFNKITSTMRVPNDDLVYKFINKFFPPSKTINLRNKIMRFQQRFDESFYEAWERFNDLVRACPHHGFSELHQFDTFYNGLNINDQDSLNSAAGGNFLDKMPRECLKIIESKSKVRQSRAKAVIAKVSSSSSTTVISSDVAELKDMVKALLLDKKNQSPAPTPSSTPAPVKAVEPNCVTCGGAHSYQNCPATNENAYRDNIQEGNNFNQNRGGNFNQSNFNPSSFNQGQLHRPQVNQALVYQAHIPQTQRVSQTDFESYVKANDEILRNMQSQGQRTLPGTKVTKDQVQTPSSQDTAPVQPSVIQSESQVPVSEPVVAPVGAPMPNLKPSIPYPSRCDNEKRRDQANEQIKKFYEIFKDMSFEISFMDALTLMPKFALTLKALIGNKEKLNEMARTPMNEHCSAVILNKLPQKLGDLGKFRIPCEFPGMDECLALADLGASINLMPFSVWEALSLPELTPTCMTLELANRSVSKPIGIAKDVSFKVGVFQFLADFMVVDFEPDPRVPLILGRCFLKTGRALIDVHKGELTLRIGKEAITYNLDQTVRYSANYDQMTANKIDVICEIYSQEVLGFSDVTASGNPTPYDDPIISTTSPTLTSFGDNDFLLFEEADAFLGLEDNPDSPKINPFYYDPEGDILLLETILNNEPLPPLPNHEQYLPSYKKELKMCEAKTIKSSVDEPPEVELKDLPHHLDLWVCSVHCVPKKGGFTVVENEENELIPTRLVTGWRVCIDYRKLNEATRKDHFPLPFMDQMLERLAENEYYCFLDGFSRYFQIPIDPRDQEKTTFTCPYGTFAYRHMPFGLCNAPGTFQRYMLAIFHDMVENTMEVFMDDFSVFRNSFENCLSRLDKMLQRCEDTNLSLNWEKSHFMVKEGIVLGHKISKNRIEVDKAKIDFIAKLPHPTTVKENLAADHLSRLENPYENVLDPKEINEKFPLETLSMVTFRGDSSASWFADFANYHAGNFIVKDLYGSSDPAVCARQESSRHSRGLPQWTHRETSWFKFNCQKKSLIPVSSGPPSTKMPTSLLKIVTCANDKEKFHNVMRCLKIPSKFLKSLTFGALNLWARSRLHEGTNIFSFGSPRAIISDCGTHFCNDQFTKVMLKYEVTHCLSTAYHPQTSGQVEVSNRGLKRILERTIGENRASWSDKLDDAFWAFRTAYKTPIWCTPYKLVYGKVCHLPIKLEHKAYWALKQANFNLSVAGDHRKVQLNELRDHAYENSLIYKEKTKRIHDSKIKNRVFNVGDRVLLFNSRLEIFSGKLKTRWSGAFTIAKVFPYGTVELSQANGPNFKMNGHRVKHYFGGDVPQLVVLDLQTFPMDN
nr:reverse transcriptase domain-containing protein [Tanacetum cinerariifolium]